MDGKKEGKRVWNKYKGKTERERQRDNLVIETRVKMNI